MKDGVISRNTYLKEYSREFVERWDQLIDWKGRREAEAGFFHRVLREHDVETVLDIACGTGFHTADLAAQGFDVTASDGAPAMISKARQNTEWLGLNSVEFHVAEWTSLTTVFPEARFDAVICLGNAFTHLFDEQDRTKALREIYTLLDPDGIAVIDHRNYDSMLDNGYSSKHQYYYTGADVEVFPDEVSEDRVSMRYQYPDGSYYHLTLCPIRQEYVSGLLSDAGFREVVTYGDFKGTFDRYSPDFIVQVARK
jgi:SAM-dependent methyltransferase